MDIENIDFKNLERLSKKDFEYKNIFLYYPSRFKVKSADENIRQIIYSFKDGRNNSYYSSLFIKYLKENYSLETLKNIVLIPIPASTELKNHKRYKVLMEDISAVVGIENGYGYVHNLQDREAKHISGTREENNIGVLSNKIENKKIILLDDIITTGRGFVEISELLMEKGAQSVEGLFLGRTATQKEYHINYISQSENIGSPKKVIENYNENNYLKNTILLEDSQKISTLEEVKINQLKNLQVENHLNNFTYQVKLTQRFKQLIQDNNELRDIKSQIFGNFKNYYVYNGGDLGEEERRISFFVAIDDGNKREKILENYPNKTISISGFIKKSQLMLNSINFVSGIEGKHSTYGIKKSIKFVDGYDISQNEIIELYKEIESLSDYKTQRNEAREKLQDWNVFLHLLEKKALEESFYLNYSSYKFKEDIRYIYIEGTLDDESEVLEKLKKLKQGSQLKICDIPESKQLTDLKIAIRLQEYQQFTLGELISKTIKDNGNSSGQVKYQLKIELDTDLREKAERGDLELPQNGYIAHSNYGDISQYSKLKNGIRNLIAGRSLNPNLINFIYNPENAEVEEDYIPLKRENLFKSSLNDSQFKAVEKSLNAKDLFLIQGPPGTGKTTVITELCYQLAKRGEKVLISSQTNLALDNVLSKFEYAKEIRALRAGNVSRVEEEGKKFTEQEVIKTWTNNLYMSSKNEYERLSNQEKTIKNLKVTAKNMVDKIRLLESIEKNQEELIGKSEILRDKILKIENSLREHVDFKENCRELINLNQYDSLINILEKSPDSLKNKASSKFSLLNSLREEIVTKTLQNIETKEKIDEFKFLDPLVDVENEIYPIEVRRAAVEILNYDKLYDKYSVYDRDYQNIKNLINKKDLLVEVLKGYEYFSNKESLRTFLDESFTIENSQEIFKIFENHAINYKKNLEIKTEHSETNDSYLLTIEEHEVIKNLALKMALKIFKNEEEINERIILMKEKIQYLEIDKIKELAEELSGIKGLKLILKRGYVREKSIQVIVNCNRAIDYLKKMIKENDRTIKEANLNEDMLIAKFVKESTSIVNEKRTELFNILRYKNIEGLEAKLDTLLLKFSHELEESLETRTTQIREAEEKLFLTYKEIEDQIENLIEESILRLESEKEEISQEFLETNNLFDAQSDHYQKEFEEVFNFNKIFSNYFKNSSRVEKSIKDYKQLEKAYLNPIELENREVDKKKEFHEFWSDIISPEKLENTDQLGKKYIENVNIVGITCVQSASRSFSEKFEKFDTVIIDEVTKATPPELLLPMLKGKRIILVGDHKQLPPSLGSSQEKDLKEAFKDLDEVELDDKKIEFQTALFKILFEKAENTSKEMLDTQYRMHNSIMDCINQFYDGKLKSGIKNPDLEKQHKVALPYINQDNHLIWIDTPKDKNYYEKVHEQAGYSNKFEAQLISKILEDIDGSYEGNHEKLKIGVITFYSKQVALLKDTIKPAYKNLSVRLGTVDRFQGIEREIIIVSFVRNNSQGKIGFADKFERINVALSRAQNLLIIVGCSELFSNSKNKKTAEVYQNVIDITNKNRGCRDVSDIIRG